MTVAVLPIPAVLSTVLSMADVRVEAFRSTGPGGQNRNKSETAIRVTHNPTQLTAVIADERSQSSNRERALALLAARVAARRAQDATRARNATRSSMHGSGFIAERFRSYLWREGKVVDHQSGASAPLRAVLDGDFSAFV